MHIKFEDPYADVTRTKLIAEPDFEHCALSKSYELFVVCFSMSVILVNELITMRHT